MASVATRVSMHMKRCICTDSLHCAALCVAGYARILVTASVATWVSIQGGLPYGASKVGHYQQRPTAAVAATAMRRPPCQQAEHSAPADNQRDDFSQHDKMQVPGAPHPCSQRI
jgi:hypothetical protein